MTPTEFDHRHLWHPYSHASRPNETFMVEKAEGVHLHLQGGHKLIDAMSSWWSVIHGYNVPQINQAVQQQMERFSHVMFGGLTHEPAIELGKKLIALTPDELTRIFYSDSGSVAIEVALKMAVQYYFAIGKYDKKTFLTLRSGYHGDTWKAMSVCDPVNGMHHLFKGALSIQHFVERPPITIDQEWNHDPQKNGLQELEATLQKYHHEIAAIILEPVVQGVGGMYFYHPEYLRQCRALCDHFDVLLIFDEIATGFGRTGKMFAIDHCDVVPDILCVGKALTGGTITMAATMTGEKLAQAIGDSDVGVFMHGPTFMGNPLACAAANASLDLLIDGPWQQRTQVIEQQFRSELQTALTLPNVADVRALGAIGVIEMKHTVNTQQAQALCKDLGVWLRPFGKCIYAMPPYITNSEQLSRISHAMCQLAAVL